MLKIEQLYYLHLVNRFGSIKLAAQSIPVTSAAVSTALHKLEDEIGLPLLERTYRGVELTSAAKEIASATEGVLKEMDKIEEIIARLKGESEPVTDNKLNFYLSRGYYQGSLGKIFEFLEEMGFDANVPDISCGNEKYLELVSQDTDAALLNFFTEPAEDLLSQYPQVDYIKVATSRPCVFCSVNYPSIPSNMKEITPKEVCKLPILLFTEGYDLAMPICEMLEEHGKLNIVGKYSNVMVVSALLEKNKGISVSADIQPIFSTSSPEQSTMRDIPIKTDMRLSLILCYNKDISRKKYELLKKMAKNMVI